MKCVLIVLFLILCIAFLAWTIGYPIYNKHNKENIVNSPYAFIVCMIAGALNVVSMLLNLLK